MKLTQEEKEKMIAKLEMMADEAWKEWEWGLISKYELDFELDGIYKTIDDIMYR